MPRKIVTDYWPKPIPTDRFDWSAHRDGYDVGEHIGYGKTEAAAIAELLELEADDEC